LNSLPTELFLSDTELLTLTDKEEEEEEEQEEQEEEEQAVNLYAENEPELSSLMDDDDYIAFGPHKLSKFDVVCLEGDEYANGDIINSYISHLVKNVIGVSKYLYFN
jgi:hypothetical protein